jgi:uncharacterized coiled-coil protein SlyX
MSCLPLNCTQEIFDLDKLNQRIHTIQTTLEKLVKLIDYIANGVETDEEEEMDSGEEEDFPKRKKIH